LDSHRQIHPGLEVDEPEEALDPNFFLAALDATRKLAAFKRMANAR
jgi:hypothetical protein